MPQTAENSEHSGPQFMAPIVDAWLEKIVQAREAKRPFMTIAEQCNMFYSGDTAAMWKPKFKSRYLGALETPGFRISLNKAFEMVAIFGPYLFWRYPKRIVENQPPEPIMPELFGLTPHANKQAEETQQQMQQMQQMMQQLQQAAQQDPNAGMQMQQVQQQMQQMQGFMQQYQQMQQQFEQAQMDQELEESINGKRTALMERYLNYSQKEQPGGTLSLHAELSITEALVKGRGILWPKTYRFPGSKRTLTGLFHDSVNNFFVDPDCHMPTLDDAQYIARRHIQPVWEVERKFGLAPGSLEPAASLESPQSQAGRRSPGDRQRRRNGFTYDLMEWWEIWSRGGIGHRLNRHGEDVTGVNPGLSLAFDETVGDFAYLCIAENIPWPLNAPAKAIETADDKQVQDMFTWRCTDYGEPFPAYLDDRWPVAHLDFYPLYNSAWPIAPLGPALGELIALNVLTASFVEQSYQNRKLIIACLKSAGQDVEEALRTPKNPAYVEINDSAQRSINEMVQYLQRPNQNTDVISAIAYVEQLFNKRTGLSEILYAQNVEGTQSRTARDVAAKQESAQIRPSKMAMDVAKWMQHAAQQEMFLAGWSVKGEDLVPLLGKGGAQLWQQTITEADPELWVRMFRVLVDSRDLKKPAHEREFAQLSTMLGYTLPALQEYAGITSDSGPLNAYLQSIAKSIELDASEWVMGPWKPPEPSPEEMQMQQQMQQLQEQDLAAGTEQKRADAAKKMADAQATQTEGQGQQIELSAKMRDAQIKGAMDQSEAQKKMLLGRMDLKKQQMDLFSKQREAQQKSLAGRQDLMLANAAAGQQIAQKAMVHQQDMRQDAAKAALDLQIKRAQAKEQRAAIRKQGGNGAGKK